MKEKIQNKKTFTQEELVELGQELGKVEITKSEVEADKKAVMKTYKNRIDGFNVRISELSDDLNNGWKLEEILCDVEIDHDNKRRIYTDANTGEFIKYEPLRKEDNQLTIDTYPKEKVVF
jgi:hypothetical protein